MRLLKPCFNILHTELGIDLPKVKRQRRTIGFPNNESLFQSHVVVVSSDTCTNDVTHTPILTIKPRYFLISPIESVAL